MADQDSILFTKEYFLQDNICRFCWAKDAMIDCTLKSPLFSKVEYCLNIDLSQYDTIYYPKKVCQTCSSKIEQFHEFKTFCHNANEQLTEILENDLDSSSTHLESLEEIKPEKIEKTVENDSPIDGQQSLASDLKNIDSSIKKIEKDANRFSSLKKVVNKILKSSQKIKLTHPGRGYSSCENSDNKHHFSKPKSHGIEQHDMCEVIITELATQRPTAKKNSTSPTYCKSCCEDFHDEDTFIKHKDDAHGIDKDGKYRCFGCGKLFLQRKGRLYHESQKCSALVKGYKCVICNRYLPTRGVYEKHMKNHRHNKKVDLPENEFKCQKCGEQFPNRRGLVLHMYQHERKRKKPEVKTHNSTYCKKCKEDFLDEEDFFQHNSEAHGVERDGSYRCFGCGKLFNVRVSCLMHESRRCPQLVNGYECTLCNTFSQTRYHHEKHMRDHRQNNTMEVPSQEPNEHAFRCSKCGEEFTMKSEWSAHLKQHSINKEYICETCGKGFANISFLNLHRSRHMGERKYQCAHCDYRCTEKAYLAIHLRKHTKEKPYACDLCPVLLSTSSSLKRHRQSHFGVKPFVCTYGDCDKKFSGRKSLKEHIEVIHERTASHPCTLCDQEFLRAGGLRRHKKQKHPEEA